MRSLIYVVPMMMIAACQSGAEEGIAQLTFHVTDDFGNAVTGAPVWMSTAEGWRPGKTNYGYTELRKANGTTDTNGFVTLKLFCKTGNVRYSVFVPPAQRSTEKTMPIGQKVYYIDLGSEYQFTGVVDDRWQPWDSKVEIVIKEALKPIPMYARYYGTDWQRNKVPEFGKAMGFDLIKGDWVSPHGKGETADLIFNLTVADHGQRKADRGPLFDASLSVTFSNEEDGILGFISQPRTGCALRSPRLAPESGYTNALFKTSYEHETESYHERREDQNYFFRVRSRRDETGKAIEALYGKIYGDISYSSKGVIRFVYFLNPTPNDRNMEYDPSRNLFTDIDSFDTVSDP